MNNNNIRKSNYELLRIISMVLIVAHHYAIHSGFEFGNKFNFINESIIQFLGMGGKIGDNIFFLISGYFLINSSNIKINKVIKLWLDIVLHNIILLFLIFLLNFNSISIKDYIKAFFPITLSTWWFISTYIIIYLFSPYYNKLFNSLDKKSYLKFIILAVVLWSILPTFTGKNYQGNTLIWFTVVYAIAGYIKRFINIDNINGKKMIILSIIMVLITYIVSIAINYFSYNFQFLKEYRNYLYITDNSFPMFLIALFIFLAFSKLDIKNNFINKIATTTLGIYLIHDFFMNRDIIWKKILFFSKDIFNSNAILLIMYSLGITLLVFICCCVIEIIYMHSIGKVTSKFSKKIENIIFSNKFYKKVEEIE